MIEMQNKNIKQYNVAGFPLFLLGCGPGFFLVTRIALHCPDFAGSKMEK
jgi:hypothetical protein